MSGIQRWGISRLSGEMREVGNGFVYEEDGFYVTYADHVEHMRQAREGALHEAIDALVQAGHKPLGVYGVCTCPESERAKDGHLIELEDYDGCTKNFLFWACEECCGYGYCGDHHRHDAVHCPAIAAIQALIGGESS